jgi:hypothetical protein
MAKQSDMNAFLKFLEMLYSPEIGTATGAYDPLTMVEDGQMGSMPLTESLMASTNEDIARVFAGLASGNLDPISAKQELLGSLGPDASTWISSSVDDAFDEISSGGSGGTSSKSSKKDIYREAGLPSPLESYGEMPELAPMSGDVQGRLSDIDTKMQKISSVTTPRGKSGVSGLMKNALLSQGLGLNTDVFSPEVAGKVKELSPARRKALLKTLQGEQEKLGAQRQSVLTENVQALERAGRTPYQDTLMKRAAMLGSLMGRK